MGIDTTSGTKPLLEDAEQNIGNSVTSRPQAGTGGTVFPQQLRDRVLNLQAGSSVGQTTSLIMTAARIAGPSSENPTPGYAGPLTGVIEFGNGGRYTRAEFDIPIGAFTGTLGVATSAIEPQDGGVILTVPTGVLRVYVRYDNRLLAPVLLFQPPQSMAQLAGVPVIGPGGPFSNIPAEPVLVKSMASYFSHPRSKVYKTLTLYVSQPIATPIAPTGAWCLPAFTKRIKVLRQPITSAIVVSVINGIRVVDQVTIAAGATAPPIDIVGHESIISLAPLAPADTVTYLALACELDL